MLRTAAAWRPAVSGSVADSGLLTRHLPCMNMRALALAAVGAARTLAAAGRTRGALRHGERALP